MKVALEVYYPPADEYRMVGKVFPWGEELVFLHEESGNQSHTNLGAPGGLDLCIMPQLSDWGVTQVHHWNRKEKVLYTIGLKALLTHGTRQRSGGRERVFTHWRYWHALDHLPYRPPWCSEIHRFGGPQDGATQLGLFGEVAG